MSKRAAEQIGAKDNDGSIREAMALLSAHTEDTSDATYGNHAESMVFNLSGQDMDKFKYCGKLFDDMMGITAPRIPAKPSAADPTVVPMSHKARGNPNTVPTPPTVPKAKLEFSVHTKTKNRVFTTVNRPAGKPYIYIVKQSSV